MPLLIDDITLLTAFQKGDAGAENVVFKKFFRPLCLFAEGITGHLAQSEDIVAEAFEKVMDRRSEFQTLDNLKAFLYRIVRNASINYTLSEKRHRSAHANIRYLHQQDVQSEAEWENEILRVELLHEIYLEINNLPDKCGEVFKMIFVQGMSSQQVADRLSIHIKTVRSHKARALQLLKTELLKKNLIGTLLLLIALTDHSR